MIIKIKKYLAKKWIGYLTRKQLQDELILRLALEGRITWKQYNQLRELDERGSFIPVKTGFFYNQTHSRREDASN